MRLVNGLVSGVFFLLAAIVFCHLQSAPPTAALVLVPVAFLVGITAAHLVPADVERQDRVGFVATLTLLFAILLWAIDGVFEPLLGFLGPGAAHAAAPLVPMVVLYVIAHQLLDFEPRDWGLGLRPRLRAEPVYAIVGVVLVVGMGMLEGHTRAEPAGRQVAFLAIAVGFEELLYRGFLLSALRERTGTPAALAAQSIIYALAGGLAAPSVGGLGVRLGTALAAGAAVAVTGWVPGVWAARLAGIVLAWWLL